MYESYWGLKIKPFQNTPDPRFLFYTQQHRNAFLELNYAIQERMGAALLVGLWGCGKTLLLHGLLNMLSPEKYRFVLINYPPQDRLELLTGLLVGLGDKKISAQRTNVLSNILMDRIRERLVADQKEGKETIVILDEAHLLKDSSLFEELRLLLNLQLKDRFLLTLILSGQPELQDSINDLKQFEQRIALKCYIGNLSYEDTIQYITHRVKVAGCVKSLFSESALDLIYEYSGGIPRRINRLCDLSLLKGSQRGAEIIDESFVQEQGQGLVPETEIKTKPASRPESRLASSSVPKPSATPVSTKLVQAVKKFTPNIDDEDSKQLYDTLLLITENIFNQVRLKEEVNLKAASKVLNKMADKLQSGDNTLLACAYRTATDNYLIGHSVNVCILTLKLGMAQKMDKAHLLVVGLSGLLHDIGMLRPLITMEELMRHAKPNLNSTAQITKNNKETQNGRGQTSGKKPLAQTGFLKQKKTNI